MNTEQKQEQSNDVQQKSEKVSQKPRKVKHHDKYAGIIQRNKRERQARRDARRDARRRARGLRPMRRMR